MKAAWASSAPVSLRLSLDALWLQGALARREVMPDWGSYHVGNRH